MKLGWLSSIKDGLLILLKITCEVAIKVGSVVVVLIINALVLVDIVLEFSQVKGSQSTTIPLLRHRPTIVVDTFRLPAWTTLTARASPSSRAQLPPIIMIVNYPSVQSLFSVPENPETLVLNGAFLYSGLSPSGKFVKMADMCYPLFFSENNGPEGITH